MDTTPKNQRALTHNAAPAAARAPQPAEHIWTLRKGFRILEAELRDRGALGAELQLLSDGVMFYGRRHVSRAIALEEAEGCRRDYESDGWTDPHAAAATPDAGA